MNMTRSEKPHGATRTLAAFFDTRPAAEKAKSDVVAAGVSGEAVKITDGRGTVTGNSAATPRDGHGLVDTIKHAFAQDQHSEADVERRPGFVVTAHVPADHYGQAREILVKEGTIMHE